MKIKFKISFIFISIFLAIVSISAFLTARFSHNLISQQVNQRLESIAHNRALHIQNFISLNLDLLNSVSSRTKLRSTLASHINNPSPDHINTIRSILEDAIATIPDFKSISIMSPDGQVIASTNQLSEGQAPANKDQLLKNINKNNFFIYKDRYGQANLYLSGPLYLDNQLLGLVFIKQDISALFAILQDTDGLGQTGQVYLIDSQSTILTSAQQLTDDDLLTKTIDTVNSRNCLFSLNLDSKNDKHLNHNAVEAYLDYKQDKVLGSHSFIPSTSWCLIAEQNHQEAILPTNSLLYTYFIVNFAGLLVFFVTTTIVSYQISHPIEKLQKSVEVVESGNLDQTIYIKSKNEIGKLANSFNNMVLAVKKSRAEIDQKVSDQTKDILSKQSHMEDQQKAILNILEDIDEEKQIAESERDKINTILYSIGDGVFVVDKDYKIVLFNQVAANLSGFSIKNAIGKRYDKILKFVYEKDGKTNDEFIKKTISTGVPKDMSNHTCLIKKDGTKIAVADSAAPLKDKNGKVIGCVVVFRDVGKEREVDKMKTEFISLASHQLRTPLSAMRWFAEMLLDGDAGKLTKEQTDFVKNIYDSNTRLIDLVNSLLNISRIESGRIIVDPKPTKLKDIVNDVLKDVKVKMDQKNLNLILSIHKDLPTINIDPKLVNQIYLNLLTNAIKYTPKGGDISIIISKKDDQVISQITDTGVGIPKSEQNKVFSKFFRGTNIIKLETDGTGLGLYLAKAVAQSSGGDLWFKSEEKQGTTFWFSLPLSGSKPKTGEVTINS